MSTGLWALLGSVLCVLKINGFSLNVTRGYQDSVYTNIRQAPTSGLICDDGATFCTCKENTNYVFDKDSLSGKCVRDHEIVKERSIGKFLPMEGTKCLGVTRNGNLKNFSCNEDNLSVKWLWTLNHQMMNLKTLKCLSAKARRKLSTERCNMSSYQEWECTGNVVRNTKIPDISWNWILPGNSEYLEKCDQGIYSYKGCYRFLDGKFIKLIDTTRCAAHHNGRCSLEIKIQAPINTEYTACHLVWKTSAFTISGYTWRRFDKAVAGVYLNTTVYPATLQITNASAFQSKWKGHLIRFDIQCSNQVGISEHNCALLKVEGTATEEIKNETVNTPSTVSTPSTSPMMSSSSPSPFFSEKPIRTNSTTPSQKLSSKGTSSPERDNQDEDDDNEWNAIFIPIITSASILFCLLLVAMVIIIVCKRQQKKFEGKNQNEEHIYEEAHSVDKGPVSPIYMDIDNLTRSKSKKSNSSRKTNGSHTYDEPTENPFYHTLERNTNRATNDNGIYEEIDDILKSHEPKSPQPKPFEEEIDV